jgi:hypothetical protein
MKAICCVLGLFLLNWLMPSEADTAEDRPVGAAFSCEPSPTQDLLPDVVGPMTGALRRTSDSPAIHPHINSVGGVDI